MTSKTPNRRKLWRGIIGMLGLLTIGSLFLWHQNRPLPAPIKIYKAVPRGELDTHRSMHHRAKVGTHSLPNAEKRSIHAHTHDGHTHTHGDVATPEPIDTPPLDARIHPNHTASETEALSPEELEELAHRSWHDKWEKEMAALTADLNAKYPDIADLGSLSLEKLAARYPTPDALEALMERAEAMQREFRPRLSALIAEMPLDHQIELITRMGDIASQNWGDEIANKIVGDFIAEIK